MKSKQSQWVIDQLFPPTRPKVKLNVTMLLTGLQLLGYYYAGSATFYFVLMVPTNHNLEDLARYTYPIAQWFYNQATWAAPIVATLLWILLAALVGVGVLWILKNGLSLIKAIVEQFTRKKR